MKIADIHPMNWEVLSAWELLQRLGFPTDSIHFHFAETIVVSTTVNDKTFPIILGAQPEKTSLDELEANFREAAVAWNADTLDDPTLLYQSSLITRRVAMDFDGFMRALEGSGFEFDDKGRVVLEQEAAN